jgi:hypothetical protein
MPEHTYVDMSDLNARYDQMAVRGLGQHTYVDTSKLNAPYDLFPPMQGLGAGIFSGNPLGALGLGQVYPWHQYSADTEELQELLNEALEEQGFCPLEVDGKLGAATCGAIRTVLEVTGQVDQRPPPACQAFTEPGTPPCPGELVRPRRAAIGDSTWLIGGGLVAAVAIGGAIYFRKKKRGR